MIPDGIEPVVGYRSWNLLGDKLQSAYDNSVWEPGQPFEAKCGNAYWEWYAVEGGGHTLEDILKTKYYPPAQFPPQVQSMSAYAYVPNPVLMAYGPHDAPNVVLPEGYGYASRIVSHDVPSETCACGAYASVTPVSVSGNPYAGDISGEVNLWGKVIQGAKAHRATFAYPKKIYCLESQREALEAYGVEIVVKPPKSKPKPAFVPPGWSPRDYNKVLQELAAVQQLYGGSPPPTNTSITKPPNVSNMSGTGPLADWWGRVKP